MDEAVRGRLRHAIVAENGAEEQLDGVMRMLAERSHAEDRFIPCSARADRRPD